MVPFVAGKPRAVLELASFVVPSVVVLELASFVAPFVVVLELASFVALFVVVLELASFVVVLELASSVVVLQVQVAPLVDFDFEDLLVVVAFEEELDVHLRLEAEFFHRNKILVVLFG